MAALAALPAGCEAKTAELSNFSSEFNNPIGIGADGNLIVAQIHGRDYYDDTDFTTTTGTVVGVGTVQFTAPDSESDYVDAGTLVLGGVTYYYKAFAIGWAATESSIFPTVMTYAVESSGVTQTTAAVLGNVTAAGTASVTERGFVYGTSSNPTTADSTVTAALGTGTGTFSATLSGLSSNTPYHVRAYAISGAGTAYGEDRTFTTLSGGVLGSVSGGRGSSTLTMPVTVTRLADNNRYETANAISAKGGPAQKPSSWPAERIIPMP